MFKVAKSSSETLMPVGYLLLSLTAVTVNPCLVVV